MLEALITHHEVPAFGVDHGGLAIEAYLAPLEVIIHAVQVNTDLRVH